MRLLKSATGSPQKDLRLLKNSSGQAKTQIVERRIRDLGIQAASITVPRALFQQPQLFVSSALFVASKGQSSGTPSPEVSRKGQAMCFMVVPDSSIAAYD
jgi:hypothetical protein